MEYPGEIGARTEEDARYRLLVDALHDYVIYMLDPTGRISSWNAGAERFHGYTGLDIVGSDYGCFYTEEDRAAGLPALNLQIAVLQGRFEGEGWRVRRDGERFWAHVVMDAIRDDQGQLLGFAKITHDMTEKRQAQRALEQAQQALFQSQKMESIGKLTGGVAHDFNNLLMAIMGSLEMVQKRLAGGDPKVLALLDNAAQGAERGAQLTQRMLAFARRQDFKTEALDLRGLVHGMAGLIQRSVGPILRIKAELDERLPLVLTDANQLESALLNLVLNARDAMPDGGHVSITVRAESLGPQNDLRLPPGDYVCLSVADTGLGMDAHTLERAMEPFFTTKGAGKGTGLGLPMAHGLAEQSGGRLRLSSHPGLGTTAQMWLPAVVGEPAASAGAPAADPPAPSGDRGLKILLTDDDQLVLMSTSAMLEDLGHTVIEAESGAQALEILMADPSIDLMVTDQAMPNMTGLQLAEAARALRPGLAVVLATGYAEVPAGSDLALERLSKPFIQADLADVVGRASRR